ncbi:MAG: TonB-dependent receptor [Sphingomonadaceae bacterium]
MKLTVRNHLRKGARTASLAVLAWGVATGTAWAQAASEPTDAADIVVTAQKREQRLQDVGISATVLGGESLANLNIANATDITRAVPNLKFNAYSSSQVVFNVRGVSQNDFGDQQEPPVAVYQDDAYASSINTASFPVFDLARVEALRGPQGTLFGRNATGGAVQFISNQPTKELSGYISGTYGRYNQTILEGALSGPLGDSLGFRIAGIYDRDDGYIRNIVPGFRSIGANNHWALRGILAFTPTADFKGKLTVRYAKADRERQAGLYSSEPACPNAQFQGEFLAPTATCPYFGPAFGVPSRPGATGTGFRNDAIIPSRGGTPYATAETSPSFVNRDLFGATLRLDAKLGVVDLVSITDYQSLRKFYTEGGDASPDLGVVFFQGAKSYQVSQEVRASAKLGSAYLVAGAYGLIIDGDYTAKFASPFYGYDPDVAFSQRTESFAIFGQAEYEFTDQFKVIGGIRYWRDKKIGSYVGTEPSTGVGINFSRSGTNFTSFGGPVQTTGVTVNGASAAPTFSGVTLRAELDYKPSDDTLIYASFNRGSKSGGFTFSTGTPFSPNEASFLNGIPYRPEQLDAYELGLKVKVSRALSFNLAAFYYDYKNYQAFAQVGPIQSVINLPAKTQGIEAELTARPLDGLTLQIGASFLKSKVSNILLPDLVSIVEHDLPQSPGASGNALARYEFDLAGGTASLQADALYTDKFCFTVLCAPVEQERAYHVENLRIGFDSANKRWSIAAFVNNVFARQYRAYAFDSSLFAGVVAGVYAKPRTWGLTAKLRFGSE